MNWIRTGICAALLSASACSGTAATSASTTGDADLDRSLALDAGPPSAGSPCGVNGACTADQAPDAEAAGSAVGDAGPSACGELGCEVTATPALGTTPAPSAGSDSGSGGDGPCFACAHEQCALQYGAAIGADSSAANLADVSRLLSCVVGPDWQSGNAIPAASCFFADPAQPRGSLVPCYCGDTPIASCVADGPAQPTAGCTPAVEIASHCSPASASCVTASGADPSTPLGDVFQLLNCERALCTTECGFPAPPMDE